MVEKKNENAFENENAFKQGDRVTHVMQGWVGTVVKPTGRHTYHVKVDGGGDYYTFQQMLRKGKYV